MENNFDNYINSLPIEQDAKNALTNELFKKKNPSYYQKYPELFKDFFNVSDSQISSLNIAGYLYFQSIINLDSLIDDKRPELLTIILIAQEESIKILSKIFNLKHSFWNIWNKRKIEYFRANVLDKKLIKLDTVSLSQYEELADGKSCFGKVAIDSLYMINSQNESTYEKLLHSHRYFSTAFQINDDIQDFKEDFKTRQFNYAIYIAKKNNLPFEKDIEVVEKLFYIRGIVKELYIIGIEYCNKALACLPLKAKLSQWGEVIKTTRITFERAILEIDNYIQILRAEVTLSVNIKEDNSSLEAINKGCDFLMEHQNKDGSWREYINQGGISSYWSTAFITHRLSSSPTLQEVLRDNIDNAMQYLIRYDGDIISYNESWIGDCDSTSFTILSALSNNIPISQSRLAKWMEYQNKDGGFSTYNDEIFLLKALDDPNITSVTGWINSHYCVSSTVLFTLLSLEDIEKAILQKLLNYLEKETPNSYWWTDNVYSLYYLALSYRRLNYEEKIEHIKESLHEKLDENWIYNDIFGVV